MKTTKALFSTLLILTPGLCSAQEANQKPSTTKPASLRSNRFRMKFAATDVSDVLQALTLKTRANIVFPSGLKKPISVDFTTSSTDEALKYITAAASLSYRQIGRTFVVALPAELRQALEPFGERVKIPLVSMKPVDAAKLLEDAIPGLTARPLTNQVLVIGSGDDILQAQNLLIESDKSQKLDPMMREVIPVQNAVSSQIVSVLKTIYEDIKVQGVGPADKPGGAIGVSAVESTMSKVRETIHSLDTRGASADPLRSYRVYEIRHSSAPILSDFLKEAMPGVTVVQGPEVYEPQGAGFHPLTSVALSGSRGAGTTGGGGGGGDAGAAAAAGPTGAPVKGERAKMLVLNGTEVELHAAEKLLAQVDIPPKQVVIDVKLIDTSPEKAEQIGAQWNFNSLNFFEVPAGSTITGAGGSVVSGTTNSLLKGQYSKLPWSFSAALSAMIIKKEAKIMADPSIRVLDGSDANIFIGDTVRTRVSSASNVGTTIQVLEFPIGIVLLVRPRVNADGRITMRIHPVVSTVTAVSNDGIPQTSAREAETTVMMKDGETIMMGGLIRDEFSKTTQEVPFLANLPIFGNLFRYHTKNRRKSEILVFITPHIVDYDEKSAVVPEFNPEGKPGKKEKKAQ